MQPLFPSLVKLVQGLAAIRNHTRTGPKALADQGFQCCSSKESVRQASCLALEWGKTLCVCVCK